MTTTTDMNAILKNFMGAFQMDTAAFETAFKNGASLTEKIATVALTAVSKNSEIANKWTTDTLSKMGDITKAKAEPVDYAKAVTDFTSAQAEVAGENMSAYAEVAKKAQMDAVGLFIAAGKEATEEAGAAFKKVASEVGNVAKKSSS